MLPFVPYPCPVFVLMSHHPPSLLFSSFFSFSFLFPQTQYYANKGDMATEETGSVDEHELLGQPTKSATSPLKVCIYANILHAFRSFI